MSSPQAPTTPLETLLRVKQKTEEAAGRHLQAAAARRAAAEQHQTGLDERVQAAREDLRARRSVAATKSRAATAAAGQERERFWRRLRDEIAASVERAMAHRRGALAAAISDLEVAVAAHRAARGARMQVEKLCQKAGADRRRIEARKGEVVMDEQAHAAAFSRAARPSSPGPSGR